MLSQDGAMVRGGVCCRRGGVNADGGNVMQVGWVRTTESRKGRRWFLFP